MKDNIPSKNKIFRCSLQFAQHDGAGCCCFILVTGIHRGLQSGLVFFGQVPFMTLYALKKTWWRIAGRLNFLFRRGLGDRCLYWRFRLFCLQRRVVFRCRWLFLLRCRLWLRWWPVRLQAFEDVSSRSLFFFLSSSRIAGRSSFGIEASATICSSVALICPVRISSCAPGTASSAASMPREYFSARRKLAQFHVNSPFRSFSMLCSPISRKTVTASGRSCISLREQN